MPEDQIILVDEHDVQIGSIGKLEAHQKGLRHRAFSTFILNDKNELMLQKRASGKYHSGGLWTNTCCGHPRDGEDVGVAARRRLAEEMGFDTDLRKLFLFHYETPVLASGLIENEMDHVFIGTHNENPILNPDEAEDWKWISFDDLARDIEAHPALYTYWLRTVLHDVRAKIGV